MDYDLYVHIPYCKRRCAYCYFTAKFKKDEMCNLSNIDRYTQALRKEILTTDFPKDKIKTLVFGGGTPSLLEKDNLDIILNAIKSKIGMERFNDMNFKAYEVSPDTADLEKLNMFRQSGFNRISIGVQSFDNKVLKLLGRPYEEKDINKAIENIKKCNYDLVNIDLLIGVPGQDRESIIDSVRKAIAFNVEHISISLYYSEYPGGKLYVEKCKKSGYSILQLEDKMNVYQEVCDILIECGYARIDNTVFSKSSQIFDYEKDAICETKELLAFGPGSAGFWKGKIRFTPPYIDKYINNPHAEYKNITIKENAFSIIWGHLNAYGFVNSEDVYKYFNTTMTEIMKVDKDVKKLIETLCENKIVEYEEDKSYKIKDNKTNEAILVMHAIRDGWGYKLDTAPKKENDLNE